MTALFRTKDKRIQFCEQTVFVNGTTETQPHIGMWIEMYDENGFCDGVASSSLTKEQAKAEMHRLIEEMMK